MCIKTLSENHSIVIRDITWKLSKMVISVEKTHKTVWVEELLGLMLLSKCECYLSADINYGWLFPSRLTDNFHWLSLVTELKRHHGPLGLKVFAFQVGPGYLKIFTLWQTWHIKLLMVDILCNCTSVSVSTTAP